MLNRFFLVALLMSGGIVRAATNTPMDRATLRGLHGLKVVVEPPSPELESAGINAENLRAQIEERLRNAGVTIDPQAREFLGLGFMAALEKKGATALCLHLDLYQNVSLERDATIKTATETWGTQSVVLVWPKQLNEVAGSTVDELTTQFINAYKSANPQAAQ
jgi:hypothetical protein